MAEYELDSNPSHSASEIDEIIQQPQDSRGKKVNYQVIQDPQQPKIMVRKDFPLKKNICIFLIFGAILVFFANFVLDSKVKNLDAKMQKIEDLQIEFNKKIKNFENRQTRSNKKISKLSSESKKPKINNQTTKQEIQTIYDTPNYKNKMKNCLFAGSYLQGDPKQNLGRSGIKNTNMYQAILGIDDTDSFTRGYEQNYYENNKYGMAKVVEVIIELEFNQAISYFQVFQNKSGSGMITQIEIFSHPGRPVDNMDSEWKSITSGFKQVNIGGHCCPNSLYGKLINPTKITLNTPIQTKYLKFAFKNDGSLAGKREDQNLRSYFKQQRKINEQKYIEIGGIKAF